MAFSISKDLTVIIPTPELSGMQNATPPARTPYKKLELHITMLGYKYANKLAKVAKKRSALEAEMRAMLSTLDLSYSETSKVSHVVREHPELGHHETLIVWVELPAMAVFYKWVNDILKQELDLEPLPVPPAHVTLFTSDSGGKGIAIESLSDRYLTITDLKT